MKYFSICVVMCTAMFTYFLNPSYALDVTLAWDANSEMDLAGYKVYYGTAKGGPYNGSGSSEGVSPVIVPLGSLTNPSSPEFTLHGLADGAYYFVVTAYNTGSLESGYSNEVSSYLPTGPDIKANGQDSFVYVTMSDSVNLTISLDPDDMVGESCDLWVLMLSSYNPGSWWPLIAFQEPLFDLPEISLFDRPLPKGWYIFLFNVEDTLDRSFQPGWYDYVVVLSSPGAGAPLEDLPDFEALVQVKLGELMRE